MVAQVSNNRAHVGQVISNSEAVEVTLSEGELFALSGNRPGVRLESVSDGLWVTQTGDPEDHWLPAGQTFVVSRPGKVVVMGTPRGRLRVISPSKN